MQELITGNRYLVREITTFIILKKKIRDCKIFLFNDLILFVLIKNGKFVKVIGAAPIIEIKVIVCNDDTFQIKWKKLDFNFQEKSADEFSYIVKQIKQQREWAKYNSRQSNC